MNPTNCGCTWTTRCSRHNPNTLERQEQRREAEQKDAQLRASGALPSPIMYILTMTVPDPSEEAKECTQ